MRKPLVVQVTVASVWVYDVSRWEVQGTAPVSTSRLGAGVGDGTDAYFWKWVAAALDKADDVRRRGKRADSYRTQDCSTVELLGTSDESLMHSKEHTSRTRSGSVDSSKNGRTNTPA